jgi:multidrug efflux system membrane fusion protein
MRGAVLVAAGTAALLGLGTPACRKAEKAAESRAAVRVATAERKPVAEWIELFGRIVPQADRDATIAPQVAGVLLSEIVREGDAVRKGQVVARVDPAPLEDAVAAAEAALRRAAADAEFRRRTAARTRGLFEKGVASGQEAESDEAAAVGAEAALAESKSTLATARRRLTWAELRAPFDGVVVKVMRRNGDTVDGTAATPVVEIAAPKPIEVDADAIAEVLRQVAVGQRAEITTHGRGPATLPGRVLRAARSVDPTSGAGEVRLGFDDPDAVLVLGTPVSIRIAVRDQPEALTVPATALRHGPDGAAQVVALDADGTTVRVRDVEVGLSDHERVEILSGLAPGDRVVVDDPVGLVDGATVIVRP